MVRWRLLWKKMMVKSMRPVNNILTHIQVSYFRGYFQKYKYCDVFYKWMTINIIFVANVIHCCLQTKTDRTYTVVNFCAHLMCDWHCCYVCGCPCVSVHICVCELLRSSRSVGYIQSIELLSWWKSTRKKITQLLYSLFRIKTFNKVKCTPIGSTILLIYFSFSVEWKKSQKGNHKFHQQSGK